jgi:hypothetical protein
MREQTLPIRRLGMHIRLSGNPTNFVDPTGMFECPVDANCVVDTLPSDVLTTNDELDTLIAQRLREKEEQLRRWLLKQLSLRNPFAGQKFTVGLRPPGQTFNDCMQANGGITACSVRLTF